MNNTNPRAGAGAGAGTGAGTAGVPPANTNTTTKHKHWHTRGYLPHCDVPSLIQSITFRLADTLPKKVLYRLQQENDGDAVKQKKIERMLDAGHGECWLRQKEIAEIVERALMVFDNQRYKLLEWCVMPNHVHVLVEAWDGWPIPAIVHSWKSFTAKEINKILGRNGQVWQEDYFDRYIRDDRHLAAARNYIRDNPVAAGLVKKASDWLHSSARAGAGTGIAGVPPANAAKMAAPQLITSIK